MSHPASEPADQPHLVSLVLQSKKALQHGQQLCSQSQSQYNVSAQEVVEVLALDAKVRWIADAIIEQLKLAAGVARCIEEKRAALDKQVKSWDISRTKYTDALESVLESLGGQVVPPGFHEESTDSSLFGSQHSDADDEAPFGYHQNAPRRPIISPSTSPSATLRGKGKSRSVDLAERRRRAKADRRRWKTLRDFVDDRAIEDILETIENDRNALADTLNQTADYPSSLDATIASLRESLPPPPQDSILGQMQDVLIAQDTIIASMAEKLESLAVHYGQMAGALKETEETGEAFGEEDMQAMNRDTEELPIIMNELDECAEQVNGHLDRLTTSRKDFQQDLDHLLTVLDTLEGLGDIMGEMLLTQDSVECEESLTSLQQQLETLDHLHERYVLYQTAFNKLVLEIARRRHYRESTETIVRGMISQLQAMTEEENQLRKRFNAECGAHIPEDICLSIGNEPTKWDVIPWSGDTREILPDIDPDLIVEARGRLQGQSDIAVGPESI